MAKKERARNYVLRFKESLSNKILETLPEERTFISKYRNIETVKISDKVVALLLRDSLNIVYNITEREILANSFESPDERVIERLKLLGERIIKIYEPEQKNYEIIRGPDFEYIDSFNLRDALVTNKIIEKLENQFKDTGELTLVGCRFILNTKNSSENKDEILLTLGYADPNDFSKKRLLVEVDERYLKKAIEVLKT